MDPRAPSPKRLRLESLREEEIVIPRITEWQFETPEGAEEGEITSARPSSSRPDVDLPARLRPIIWRNIGRSARRGGLWNQVLEFLAWEADCRRSGEERGVEQRHESRRNMHQSVSNEGEETGALGGIEAWGETGSDGLDRGDGKVAPFLCPQPIPSGPLSVGAKTGADEAGEMQRGRFEAASQSEERPRSPSTVESTLSPNPLAIPEKVEPAANGVGGPTSGAELLEVMSPVSVLSSPTLKEPKQPSASPAEASQLVPPAATNGTPVEAFKAADATPASEHGGPSKPQTLSQNGSREGGPGNAAPVTMSRGAEVVEENRTAKVPPHEVGAVQDVNHVDRSLALGTATAAFPKTATDDPQGAAFGAGPGNVTPCKLGALHDVHHFEQSKASACPKTATDGLQGAAFGVGPGPEMCGVRRGDSAGKESAPPEGCQQVEALRSGDMPAAGEKGAQPAHEIGTGGASTTGRASVGDTPAANPADSVDDLALLARIVGAHKGLGQGRCKLNGHTGVQQLGARAASGALRLGDLAGGDSGLPSNGAPGDRSKKVEGVPENRGYADVLKDLPEVSKNAPPLLCPPSKDCHVAPPDGGALGPTKIAYEETLELPNRSEELTLNGHPQQVEAERPTSETLTRVTNQGETGVTDGPVLEKIPRLLHGNTRAAVAEEPSARIPKRDRREASEAAHHKVPRVSPRWPAESIVETPDPVGGLSEAQACQQHISASLQHTVEIPNPAGSVAQPLVDRPPVELEWGIALGEKDCGAVPNDPLRQRTPLALTDETTSMGAPKSEALLPGGSSLELPDMSDVELAALLEHVPLPDGDTPHAVDGGELGVSEPWSLLGQSLLGSFKSLPCLLSAAPAEETVPHIPRNRSLKRSFSEMDIITGGRQVEPTVRRHVSKKATFVVTVPAKRPRPSVEARVLTPSMDAPTVLESNRICTETEDLDSPTMSTSFIDRDMALLGLTGLGTSLEDGHVSATCCPPAIAPTLSKPRKGRKRAARSLALLPSSFALTKPRNKRKGRGPAGKRKFEELALDDAQEDSRRALLLAEIAREISERERVVELESLLLDGLPKTRRIKLCTETIDIR